MLHPSGHNEEVERAVAELRMVVEEGSRVGPIRAIRGPLSNPREAAVAQPKPGEHRAHRPLRTRHHLAIAQHTTEPRQPLHHEPVPGCDPLHVRHGRDPLRPRLEQQLYDLRRLRLRHVRREAETSTHSRNALAAREHALTMLKVPMVTHLEQPAGKRRVGRAYNRRNLLGPPDEELPLLAL